MKHFFGRKVAVDASMSIYQFLIAVRSGPDSTMLTNDQGEVTSHLQGFFYRTIRMMDDGVKPCFVFDGKPPTLKAGELKKRVEKRDKAESDLAEAKDKENKEDAAKYSRRLVKVSKEQNEECKRLLRLMGVPIIEAPGEAEAQCAALVKADKVFAVATEDMDALTFGAGRLLRHMTFSQARKLPIVEVELKKVLDGLQLTMPEFIELCILCGCDYTGKIPGIGPMRALTLVRKHKTIKKVIKNLDTEKNKIPEDFQHDQAHNLFENPEVLDEKQMAELKLDWKDPDEPGLIQFLVNEKGFNIDRVKKGIERLKKAKGKGTQQRMESFFGPVTVVPNKRKAEKEAEAKSKKKQKGWKPNSSLTKSKGSAKGRPKGSTNAKKGAAPKKKKIEWRPNFQGL